MNYKTIGSISFLGFSVAALFAISLVQAETKVSQKAEVGYQNVDIDSTEAKFEEYGEVPEGPILKKYILKLEKDNGVDLKFKAKNVRQEDQSFKLSISKDRKTNLVLSWDQSPHLYSNDIRTPYRQTQPGEFHLPLVTRTSLSALNATSFVNTINTLIGEGQTLGFRSDKASLAFSMRPIDSLKVGIGVSEQIKKGNKAIGASFGFSHVVELPQPIDSKTYNTDLNADYSGKLVQASFRYGFSSFNNDIENMTWDNGKRVSDRATSAFGYIAGDQSAQGRMSLAPDNSAHNVGLSLGGNLPHNTRVTASFSAGYSEQNRNLLPYTINSAIIPGAAATPPFDASNPNNLTTNRANAQMMTWTQDFRVHSNPLSPLTLGFLYHVHQLDNRTSEVEMPGYVRFDQVWESVVSTNVAFQYRKDKMEGKIGYRIIDPVSVGLSYAKETTQRDHREVHKTKENTLKAITDIKPLQWLMFRGSILNARRAMEDFDIDEQVNRGEIPGMRRFDVADRTRNMGTLSAQAYLDSVSMAISASRRHDDFRPGKGELSGVDPITKLHLPSNQRQMYGVLESRSSKGSLDLGWDATKSIGVTGFYEYEEDKSRQRSNSNGAAANQDAANDWVAQIFDRYHTAGIELDVRGIKDWIDVHLGYDFNRSMGATDLVSVGSALQGNFSLPNTETTRQDIKVRTELKISKNLSFGIGYLFQKYDISDFAVGSVPFGTGSQSGQTNIYLGDSVSNYVAHVTTVLAKYRW